MGSDDKRKERLRCWGTKTKTTTWERGGSDRTAASEQNHPNHGKDHPIPEVTPTGTTSGITEDPINQR